jgi:hypothetical protein
MLTLCGVEMEDAFFVIGYNNTAASQSGQVITIGK